MGERPDAPQDKAPEGVLAILKRYWEAYEGWREFWRSPYLRTAFVLTLPMFHLWTGPGWWDTVLAILPNILGFALGGYAILMSFGGEDFMKFLVSIRQANGTSLYLVASAIFTHFIIVQTLALLLALLAKSLNFNPANVRFLGCITGAIPGWHVISEVARIVLGFLGFLAFLYSLCLAVASTLTIFRMSRWYDIRNQNKPPRNQ